MDVRPYKQNKSVWRLVLSYCTIQSAVAVFQTCKENSELVNDEQLWTNWCLRDFERTGTRKGYIARFQFGSYIWFSNGREFFTLHDQGTPCYLFKRRGNFFVTYRRHRVSTIDWRVAEVFFSSFNNYETNPLTKTISVEKQPLQRLHLFPLFKWIDERFQGYRQSLLVKGGHFSFVAYAKPGYEIRSKDWIVPAYKFDKRPERSYTAYYDGRLVLVERPQIEVWVFKDGAQEQMPVVTIDQPENQNDQIVNEKK